VVFDALQSLQSVNQGFFADFVDAGQREFKEGWVVFFNFDEGGGFSYFEGDVSVFLDFWGPLANSQCNTLRRMR